MVGNHQEDRKPVRVAWREKVLDSATLPLIRKRPFLEAGFHNVWWPGDNTVWTQAASPASLAPQLSLLPHLS